MPDPFTNARPYFDVAFPSSGDSFSIHGFRNAFAGLGFLDFIPLQPRAHNPADRKIMVRGQDASQFYNPVYAGNADQRIPFASGDTINFAIPASNPRIDIVYLTPSGDIKIQQGTEAVTPTLPSLSPSGDSRFPICAVYCKVGMTKVVNFEDKDSNSGDGYIYKDLRPFLRSAGAGAAALGITAPPAGMTGDNAGSLGTAARSDHSHQGVHAIRVPGSPNLGGDVEFAGRYVSQSGNRLNFSGITPKGFVNFTATAGSVVLLGGVGFASVARDAQGDFTITITSMPSAVFFVNGICTVAGSFLATVSLRDTAAPLTQTTILITCTNSAGSKADPDYCSISWGS